MLSAENVLRGHMNKIESARIRAAGLAVIRMKAVMLGDGLLDEFLCVSLSRWLAIGKHA